MAWEGVPGLHSYVHYYKPFFCAGDGKYWTSTEKVEYTCTTTNLPVCFETL